MYVAFFYIKLTTTDEKVTDMNPGFKVCAPLSSESGTLKTVRAIIFSWLYRARRVCLVHVCNHTVECAARSSNVKMLHAINLRALCGAHNVRALCSDACRERHGAHQYTLILHNLSIKRF